VDGECFVEDIGQPVVSRPFDEGAVWCSWCWLDVLRLIQAGGSCVLRSELDVPEGGAQCFRGCVRDRKCITGKLILFFFDLFHKFLECDVANSIGKLLPPGPAVG
jgi:hypothetical protein